MVDRHFCDPDLAELCDYFNFWRCSPQDDFHLDLVMDARRVLDAGCGTGKLHRAARERGHTGRLVGLDPAEAMLEVGRRDRDDVEWTPGELPAQAFEGEFDLVVMSGHAFQVLLTDDALRGFLAAVRRALTDDGRFVFETRNPTVRGWEAWTPERVRTVDGPVDAGPPASTGWRAWRAVWSPPPPTTASRAGTGPGAAAAHCASWTPTP